MLRRHCEGRSVWDVFAYSGRLGPARPGRGRAPRDLRRQLGACLRVDPGEPSANGWSDRAQVVQANAFDQLRDLPRHEVEVLVLDPPAFAKSKKDLKAAVKAYVDINREGLRKLAEGGVLATCSCSFHVPPELFDEVLARAVFQSRQRVELLHVGGQGPDHPVQLEFPESRYLKTAVPAEALVSRLGCWGGVRPRAWLRME